MRHARISFLMQLPWIGLIENATKPLDLTGQLLHGPVGHQRRRKERKKRSRRKDGTHEGVQRELRVRADGEEQPPRDFGFARGQVIGGRVGAPRGMPRRLLGFGVHVDPWRDQHQSTREQVVRGKRKG